MHNVTRYRRGCRCDICRAAQAEYQRDYRTRIHEAKGTVKRPYTRHPDEHGYTPYLRGCRCDICREANNERSRRWRARPIEARYITHGHGGYSAGCRCGICTGAHRVYMRVYMRERRAKQAVTAGGNNEKG